MSHHPFLGCRATLAIESFSRHGAHLCVPDDAYESDDDERRDDKPDSILLLGAEIPTDAHEGTRIDVFVYLDSQDRPIATTQAPKLELGEVAFLEVTDLTPVGAFVDWGLPKDLLVPFAEQLKNVRLGERYAVGLAIDDTGRLAGTMRVSKWLQDLPDYETGQWLPGEVWRNEPNIGLFVILERRVVGLLPAQEAHSLRRGDAARFRVSRVLADGKVELSLRKPFAEAVEHEGDVILGLLAQPNAPQIGDHSSPEQIRKHCGMSKKAFKRAAGRLLKERRVAFDANGNLILSRL